MMDRAIAIAAVWRCRRCGTVGAGASMAVVDSPAREVTATEVGELPVVKSTPEVPTLDARLLRCPACGSSGVEIPIELFDGKYLR